MSNAEYLKFRMLKFKRYMEDNNTYKCLEEQNVHSDYHVVFTMKSSVGNFSVIQKCVYKCNIKRLKL